MSRLDARLENEPSEGATPHRVLPLLDDPGNQRVLAEWIRDHPEYDLIELEGPLETTQFDICIADPGSLERYQSALEKAKRAAYPVLLPCLLVTPDSTSITPDPIDTGGEDGKAPALIDEIVTPPVEQAELGWRVSALLRLRHQSRTINLREQELRRSNQRLEATIDAAPNAIIVVDQDGTVTQWNDAAERIFEWSEAEVLGEPNPIIPTDKEAEFETWVEQILDGEWISSVETERLTKSGDRLDVRLSTAPIFDGDGNPEGAMAIIEDITAEKEQRARFQAFVEHSSDVITVIDDDGRIVYESPSVEAFVGHPPEKLEGTTGLQVIHPDDRQTVIEAFDSLLDQPAGSTETVEYRVRHANGTIRWAESTATSRSDIVASGLVINTRDITDRKDRERQIRESERRYRLLADHFPDGMVALFDEDLRYLLVGPDHLPVSNLSADEMEGQSIYDFFPEDTVEEIEPHYRAALDGEERSFEVEFNGHVFRMDVVPVVEDAEGKQSTGMVVARDITERVERERDLRAIDESRRLALEASQAGIWQWTPSDGGMEMHETCQAVFGLSPGTFEGTLEAYLDLVHPVDRPIVEETLARAAQQNDVFELTYRIVRPDGTERWIDGRGKVIHDRRDKPPTMVGVNVDITERKEWQKQLAVVGRVLRHDLRNDMNVITGWAETIMETADEPLNGYAERILNHANNLIETAEKERAITELLTAEPQRRDVDVSSTVSSIAAQIRTRYPDAIVSVQIPDAATATATTNLGQAIEELVENAIIHAESTEPHVDIAILTDPDRVRIEISDDGPGIPDSEVEVFRTGQQIEPLKHSSGMGLWLVYWIVNRSRGTLQFDETSEVGTTISIELERSEMD